MPSFWSSSSFPYQPIAQESEKLLSESGSESDLPAQVQAAPTGGQWMGRALLIIAAANVLIALGTLLATRDISALRIPIAAMDISALPRPDPNAARRARCRHDRQGSGARLVATARAAHGGIDEGEASGAEARAVLVPAEGVDDAQDVCDERRIGELVISIVIGEATRARGESSATRRIDRPHEERHERRVSSSANDRIKKRQRSIERDAQTVITVRRVGDTLRPAL
ncbi:hypothetical protein FB451DRAFT_1391881 [Mycena latifolia]|nr:hypothetical protein FB451DRAFT_1391881 [Mycena latifolia]